MKLLIKNIITFFIYWLGPHRWPSLKPKAVILGYHRVIPKDHIDISIMQPGMYVYPETFEMHIKTLGKYFHFMSLNEWVDRTVKNESIPKRVCILTFDDGWVDNYEYAFPILKKYNVPATIYLVSQMLIKPAAFWPERLARILWNNGEGLAEQIIEHIDFAWIKELNVLRFYSGIVLSKEDIDNIITAAKRYSDEEINIKLDALESIAEPKGIRGDIVNLHQVKEMLNSRLIEIGAHTRLHKRMDKIQSDKEISNEIVMCKDELQEMLSVLPNSFCYPNGIVTDKALEKVKENYSSACTTEKGINNPNTSKHLLKRYLIHNDISDSPSKILSSVSGFF